MKEFSARATTEQLLKVAFAEPYEHHEKLTSKIIEKSMRIAWESMHGKKVKLPLLMKEAVLSKFQQEVVGSFVAFHAGRETPIA